MNDNITLPRSVVEQAITAIETTSLPLNYDNHYEIINSLRAALEQPQRKLTPQDIADSALLGNIESPLNACMHQEHCKRWKEQAEQHAVDHQRESSSGNDLPSENGQLITSSSTVPTGWKLVPVEPTVEMMDAGGAATRRCYQHLNKGEVMCSYVYRHMLDAAPQPPTTEQSSVVEQPQGEQEPVAWMCTETRVLYDTDTRQVDKHHGFKPTVPLYTHPQPPRQPLTDEQIAEIASTPAAVPGSYVHSLARAIERAHGIGGEA